MKTLKQALDWAENRKVAIGHFNISNLEQLKAIANVAIKLNLPAIIGVSEGEREFIGVKRVRDLIDSYNNEYGKDDGFYLFLNADHTHTLEKSKVVAEKKFDAVIFDASKLNKEENTLQTKEAVEVLKSINSEILIEGELGYIGSGSKIISEIPEGAAIDDENMTNPIDAAEFVKITNIDLFAPAVGNIHGMFKNAPNPKLDIERIKKIKEAVKIPLVLHGGSGISDEDFVLAINAGISVIHISTELRRAYRKSLDKVLEDSPDEISPYRIMNGVVVAMEEVVENRLKLFNRI